MSRGSRRCGRLSVSLCGSSPCHWAAGTPPDCGGGGWRADPLILVEGLFDGLSLAMCDLACIATIGRWAPWLPEIAAGRKVWLAFDASKPGEADVAEYSRRLRHSEINRLLPPARCKDWNTALRKIGRSALTRWLHSQLVSSGVTHQHTLEVLLCKEILICPSTFPQ